MIITNFDLYNEGFLDIDLTKIKAEAFKFSRTKDCVKLISTVDSKLLDSVVDEYKKLTDRWGSIDTLSNKVINKASSTNEGIAGTIILSIFGIHFFMKLLGAIKDNSKIKIRKLLASLFYTDSYNGESRTLRDIVISVIFCIYLIGFILFSNIYNSDCYKTQTGSYTDIPYKWNGMHSYVFIDSFDKKYDVNHISGSRYDIIYNGKKIGTTDCSNMYKLDGTSVLSEVSFSKNEYIPDMTRIDLEKLLTSHSKVTNNDKIEIDSRKKAIRKLNHEIDSINAKVYENKNSKKFKEEQLLKMKNDILYYFQSLIDDSESHSVEFGPRMMFSEQPYMKLILDTTNYKTELKRSISKFKQDYPNLEVTIDEERNRNSYISIYISYKPNPIERFRRLLNKPKISKFIDFYNSGDN